MNPACARAGRLAFRIALGLAVLVTAGPVPAADRNPEGMLGFASGEQIYTRICQGCHMPGGRGAQGAGNYPALAGDPALASARFVAATILNGRRNMPAFERDDDFEFFFGPTWLTDAQVANVVNYVRSHFGNRFDDPITADEVAALHASPERK